MNYLSGRNYPYVVKSNYFKTRLISDLSQEWVSETYKKYGALLFRGFNLDMEKFKEFSSALCNTFRDNPLSGRLSLDQDVSVQSVDLGYESFPLHNELCITPNPPDTCFFFASLHLLEVVRL